VVHICGPYSQSNLGACNSTNASVSDVSLFQIKLTRGVTDTCSRTDVVDDVTGTVIGYGTNYNTDRSIPLGIYILGEETVPNGTSGFAPGYSRFSTSPSVVVGSPSGCVSYTSSDVPTWGVGASDPTGDACSTPGALFSYTLGVASHSVFVCSGGFWKEIA
jgi:hypothetical protein